LCSVFFANSNWQKADDKMLVKLTTCERNLFFIIWLLLKTYWNAFERVPSVVTLFRHALLLLLLCYNNSFITFAKKKIARSPPIQIINENIGKNQEKWKRISICDDGKFHNRALGSISPTFYVCIFRRYSFDKKSQSRSVVREKLWNLLSYEKCAKNVHVKCEELWLWLRLLLTPPLKYDANNFRKSSDWFQWKLQIIFYYKYETSLYTVLRPLAHKNLSILKPMLESKYL